jgi:glycerol-3-phosphate dehydrogenase
MKMAEGVKTAAATHFLHKIVEMPIVEQVYASLKINPFVKTLMTAP